MIGLIGSFCGNRESASGQAVRTTFLFQNLSKRYGAENIFCVDTHELKRRPIQCVFRTMQCIASCRHIIVMVHEKGRKIFFPILYLAVKLKKRNVYHNVIGGSFKEYLDKHPWLIRYTKSFRVNWVQMQSQIEKLKAIGVENCELLPNTKELRAVGREELKPYAGACFRFCMCSRISAAKGMERAIAAVQRINREYGKTIAALDIYGKPDDDYAERFRHVLSELDDSAVRYCGFIPNDQTVQTIKDYFMLLFPTTYAGEGFPGTVWDAFAAGVPIIATDWHYNAEIITDGKHGFIYDYRGQDALYACIKRAISNPDAVNAMKINCLEEIRKYSPEKVFPIIYKYFDQ